MEIVSRVDGVYMNTRTAEEKFALIETAAILGSSQLKTEVANLSLIEYNSMLGTIYPNFLDEDSIDLMTDEINKNDYSAKASYHTMSMIRKAFEKTASQEGQSDLQLKMHITALKIYILDLCAIYSKDVKCDDVISLLKYDNDSCISTEFLECLYELRDAYEELFEFAA